MQALHDNLVANIRRLARRHGWSVNRTADAAGLSRSGLSNIMRGAKSPSLATVEKLAIAFDVRAIDLLKPDDGAEGLPRSLKSN